MNNYKPITRRAMEARSSMLKQTEEQTKKTAQGTVQIDGNLHDATGDATSGGTKTVPYTGKKACDDPNSAACKQYKAQLDKCKADPNAEGCKDFMSRHTGTQNTEGDVNVNYNPKKTEQQYGSSIDLMGPQEVRGNTRANLIATRNVKKASRKLKRMQKRFENGKINQETLTAYEDQLKNAVARSKNIGEQATGMRNRYLTQRMQYGRKLQSEELGGQPVKAPEGTQTPDEFEKPLNEFAGKTTPATTPPATTPPPGNTGSVSSFASLLSSDAFQPVKLNGGSLFGNLGSLGDMTKRLQSKAKGVGKMTNKPGAFKMKGYGSNR